MLHVGHLREGKLALGAKVTARVDRHRRQAIRRAHSATHILHHCLQSHLGTHAQQQGSKVDADWLRFDFTNPSAVDREALREIEDHVNKHVCKAEAVSSQNLPLAEAREAGAMMLFGEKYPEVVRLATRSTPTVIQRLTSGSRSGSATVCWRSWVGTWLLSAMTRSRSPRSSSRAMTSSMRPADCWQPSWPKEPVFCCFLRNPSSIVPADLAIVLREDCSHVIGQHFLQHQITGR